MTFKEIIKNWQNASLKEKGSIIDAVIKLGPGKDELRELYHLEDRDLFYHVVDAIGEANLPGAFDLLRPYLTDEDEVIRDVAILSIGQSGDQRAVPLLFKLLHDPETSGNAARALGDLGDETAVPHLIEALLTTEEVHWGGIAEGLGKLPDSRAITPLIEAYVSLFRSEKSDPFTLRYISSALAQIGVDAKEQLIGKLASDDPDTREAVISALVDFREDTEVVETIMSALNDKAPQVRSMSIKVLRVIKEREAVDPLREVAGSDPDSDVREEAQRAINYLLAIE